MKIGTHGGRGQIPAAMDPDLRPENGGEGGVILRAT